MYRCFSLLAVLPFLLLAAPAAAQETVLDRPLRVFLDCSNFGCDGDYIREQTDWVAFVRDRTLADVHLFIAEEETGGGGESFTLRLIGRGPFAGDTTQLVHVTTADVTDDEERQGLTRVIQLGLLPYATSTSEVARLSVAAAAADVVAAAPAAAADPWDRWTFEVGASGFLEGESQQESRNVHAYAGGQRVTAGWKHMLRVSSSISREEFTLDDTTTFVSSRESYSASGLTVKSLTPHWSAGTVANWSRSTFSNRDASMYLAPAVEYDLFPYSESTRRLLTVIYAIGPRYYDYAERTLFEQLSETVLEQLLVVSYDVNQPWGNVDVAFEASHLITRLGEGTDWPDPQYSLEAWGGLEVRLLRGLSLELDGNVELVRDQIQLAAGDLTDEEILTQQRELATDYRYWMSVGLSYQFGSIYSAVVNPRFEYFD